jgi:hypothetical protein
MSRLKFAIIPVLAAASLVFGLVWGWIGINAAFHEGGPVAYLLILFGFGGIVLALALWRAWRVVAPQAK